MRLNICGSKLVDEICKRIIVLGLLSSLYKPKRGRWRTTGQNVLRERRKGFRSPPHYGDPPFISSQKYASSNNTELVPEQVTISGWETRGPVLPVDTYLLLFFCFIWVCSLPIKVHLQGWICTKRKKTWCLCEHIMRFLADMDRDCESGKCLIG